MIPELLAGGGLVALVGYTVSFILRSDRRLFGLADRQTQEIATLREEMTKDEARIDELEKQQAHILRTLATYRAGVMLLIGQIRRLGAEPDWTPPAE